ncbi:lytic transglycosylase domain-containing protein [Salipiger mangrovisoli]|uniref:Lytic transglycosylase domain-containing protein n=1 Tax=Salipiger mangrovisoli TaxID=2865933 RepID=A0ABR9X0I0_9RHOB|nr:lytic transglycosylase domain-containing protein [Salipiger mangrovisoli]MBE9637049.1 lytic transglycosylase domain-containing protein [Salipiger mangrovisoli]
MRGLWSALLAVAALVGSGQSAVADWSDFYRPTPRTAEPMAPVATATASAPSGICIREILRAQLRHQIPGNLLLGIGLQESGMMHEGELTIWPWTANAEGDGRYFNNPETAASWVRARQKDGVASVDVGCMQVNLRWHPEAFVSLEHGFDPARNVDYAARLLVSLYEQTGDWVEAAGRYHSATPEYQQVYLGRLKQNVAIANDRLDIFRALAAGAGDGDASVAVAVASAEPLPEGHFWTSWLTTRSGAADEGARSLYGREVMQPVLPAFRKMF